MEQDKRYFGYITSNADRTSLDVGVTGDLARRMHELREETYLNGKKEYVKLDCIHLVYWETFHEPVAALKWEEKVRSWSDRKKRSLVGLSNPQWEFMNGSVV